MSVEEVVEKTGLRIEVIHPVLTTSSPRKFKNLEERILEWCEIKNEVYNGRKFNVKADFYGSMDGASKFVKGDAIAGILILFINIIGGLVIGMVQHDLTFDSAVEIYTLLTIGDGLVAQIPGLLLSVATAIVVTRQNTAQDMGEQVSSQLGQEKSLYIAAAVMFVMGVVPGMPHFVFLFFATVIFLLHCLQVVSSYRAIFASAIRSFMRRMK